MTGVTGLTGKLAKMDPYWILLELWTVWTPNFSVLSGFSGFQWLSSRPGARKYVEKLDMELSPKRTARTNGRAVSSGYNLLSIFLS